MRAYLNLLLIVGLSVAIVYVCWVTHPPSRYEPQFQEMVQRHKLLREKLAKDAKDPDLNGCLEPNWAAYWKDPKQTAQGRVVLAIQRSPTPSAWREFKKYYPSLHKALSLPQLNGAGLTAIAPLTHVLLEDFRHRRDLELLADALRLIGPGSLGSTTRGRDYQLGMCQECLDELRDAWRRQDLIGTRPASLRSLQQALARAAFPEDAIAVAAESDALRALEDLEKGGPERISPPGYWQRELRLYKNDVLSSIARLRDGEPASLSEPRWGDYFWGKRSWLAWTNHVDPPDPQAFRTANRQMGFYHLCIEVLVFRQENGTWPLDLPRLQRSGYKPLPGIVLKKVTFEALGDRLYMSDGDLSWDVN